MTTRSAYTSSGSPPSTTLSAVAICDVLGFSEMVREAERDQRTNELLAKLRAGLGTWFGVISDSDGFEGRRLWEVKAFTDNVVIGIPVHGAATGPSLAQLLMSTAAIQRGLTLELGLFVRGGAAIGPLYIDDIMVFGIGLLDAYAKEQKAVFPRVVLHASAAEEAIRSYGATHSRSPLGGRVIRDEDGELFVNYLEDAWPSEDESPRYDWLARHRELTSNALSRFNGVAKIAEKYVWAARYHNYICALIPDAESHRMADQAALRVSSVS